MSFPKFKLKADFKPTGSQPDAIEKLVEEINKNPEESKQTLLGVTGSGNVITSYSIHYTKLYELEHKHCCTNFVHFGVGSFNSDWNFAI